MEVTVLGKSNAWPDAGGACSGYLVREGEFRMLLDCGAGVFSKLRAHCSYADIDAVLISHLHADHILDLIPYSYALSYSTVPHDTRPHVFGPPGTRKLFAQLGEVLGFGEQLQRRFEVSEYDARAGLSVGPVEVRLCEVPHFIQTFACELTSRSEGRFTYGADCRYNEELIEFARDTDLLVLEATEGAGPAPVPAATAGHMNARQAGELGRAAGAKRLVLSHYSDELDAERVARAGAAGFGNEVILAREDASFAV